MTACERYLAACRGAVERFLLPCDSVQLSLSSRLLDATHSRETGTLLTVSDSNGTMATYLRDELTLARELQVLTAKRRRPGRAKARIGNDQIRALLRDLVLVGLRIRPSCLVDVCRLEGDVVSDMLEAFAGMDLWKRYGIHKLRAVLFAGNVFFVQPSEWIRLKSMELLSNGSCPVFVDASGVLSSPTLMDPDRPSDLKAIQAMQHSVGALVDSLVALQSRLRSEVTRVLHFDARGCSAAAIAGLMLCYPIVYYVASAQAGSTADPYWAVDENCLAMCPLHTFQVTLSTSPDHDATAITLQEFSIPQHLVRDARDPVAASRQPRKAPSLQWLQRRCLQSLDIVLETSLLEGFHARAEIRSRILPQVAL